MKQLNARAQKWLKLTLWILLGAEFLSTLIVLGSAGSSPGHFADLDVYGPPGKLIYNIVCAVFTFLILLVVIPLKYLSPPWWNTSIIKKWAPWPAVAANALGTIFWIGALSSSVYTCSDLCGISLPEVGYFHYASLCCTCPDETQITCLASGEAPKKFNVNLGGTNIGPTYFLTQAFNALGMLFFMASTAIILVLHFMGSTPAPAGDVHEYDNPHSAWDPVENPAKYKEPFSQDTFVEEEYHGSTRAKYSEALTLVGEESRRSTDGLYGGGGYFQQPDTAYHGGGYQPQHELNDYDRQERMYNGA